MEASEGKIENTMKIAEKQMRTGVKVGQEEMKAMVSTRRIDIEAALNSTWSELEESNYRAEDCLRGTAHAVRPADGIKENPPPLEGSFSKTEAAPIDSLDVRCQYHR
jgi:hypothetical protein